VGVAEGFDGNLINSFKFQSERVTSFLSVSQKGGPTLPTIIEGNFKFAVGISVQI